MGPVGDFLEVDIQKIQETPALDFGNRCTFACFFFEF